MVYLIKNPVLIITPFYTLKKDTNLCVAIMLSWCLTPTINNNMLQPTFVRHQKNSINNNIIHRVD
ncbi:unnamed protein product [Commensalibacter papalotli (ex Botero et al. 2024)]|uniref:Uncharacterized protein n=1 Tax=Commensalibacter papalotli (ex Botero et al. 2024) TaxID=2972766 RepID=A0ABM9HJJ4_9PROT|nr:unnamed protein product [Commensalibacter papalotli (ex Botero et al. 2024)]CAI3927969.1 unnamed protein product [Commensalibacter papalotli (ex Botero et al. 2024)]